ncbi:MAG: hypothetical protein HXY18_19230 [Bryobacteraceae bacterium]|nr:hypothetical protein [Bryobacteraceae bacterium]
MGFAQSAPEPLQTPWEGVPERFRNHPIGKLAIPSTLNHWRSQRPRIKGIVLDSLGELPPRHSPPAVKIAGVDRKPGWRIEKCEVHNDVDSLVPGTPPFSQCTATPAARTICSAASRLPRM